MCFFCALAIFKCAFACALPATLGILWPTPFPRSQVGRKTGALCPTCNLQFMRWNLTIYFSRTFYLQFLHWNHTHYFSRTFPWRENTWRGWRLLRQQGKWQVAAVGPRHAPVALRPNEACAHPCSKNTFCYFLLSGAGGPDPALQRAGERCATIARRTSWDFLAGKKTSSFLSCCCRQNMTRVKTFH